MRTKILLTILVVSLLAACTKDKYQTRPQLKYKKANTQVLRPNEFLTMFIQVTDAEGDIQDSIWIEKIIKNYPAGNFTSILKMPDFVATKNLNAEIEINYKHGIPTPEEAKRYATLTSSANPRPQNDTTTFRFYIKDKAKNTSDTAVSEVIIITR
jgi:hypothetical protein